MPSYCAGVDLGTTNTVLAAWIAGERGPRVLPILQPWDALGPEGIQERPLLDSVVALGRGKVWVGGFARQLGLVGATRSFSSIKRHMGHHWFHVHEGFGWTPERVSACILRVVRDNLIRRFDSLPEQLVVTIPACFGTEARRATLEAAHLAGFRRDTISLFDEPTAALLAEMLGQGAFSVADRPELHLVADIGGGTFDVSLVRVGRVGTRTLFDVVGQSRYNELAGDDFDMNIAGLLLHRYEEAHGGIGVVDDERKILFWSLLTEARSLKHRLSQAMAEVPPRQWAGIAETATIAGFPEGADWRAAFTGSDLVDALREYFPDSSTPEARRAEFGFFKPIQECLDTAGRIEGRTIGPEDIDHVWLAGGSSGLPPVRVAMQHILRTSPRLVHEPMLAVAMGAAWRAGMRAGFVEDDFSLTERIFDGIFLMRSDKGFLNLVPPRQRVPMPRVVLPDVFRMPATDNRLEIELYVGTDTSGDQGELDLTPLARRRATFPRILQAGEPITVVVELSSDRDLRIELLACENTGSELRSSRLVSADVAVSTGFGWETMGRTVLLPPVNVIEDEA